MYYKGEKVEGPITPSTDFHGYGTAIRAEIASLLPKNENIKILDVGTGFGSTVSFLVKHLSKGSKIWTVDPSKEVLDGARTKLAQEGLDTRIPTEFVQASAAKLDFKNDFFDTIISVMVLHHVESLAATMNELVRVLRKGGRLILVDYAPQAGKDLVFHTRHLESDFFEPARVVAQIRQTGVSNVKLKQVNLWYLVDTTK